MYTLIGGVNSRAFRPLWALEELGVEYTHQPAEARAPEVYAKNPLGKVPVMLDGDAVLTDSVAIMTFLADKHGGLTAPAGTPARAQQDAMTCWLIDEFDAVLWMAAKHSFVLPQDQRVPEIKPYLKDAFAKNVDTFADHIAGEFVMGDTMTVADILAVHCLNWAHGAKFAYDNNVVDAYARRLRGRDAFKRVRARLPKPA